MRPGEWLASVAIVAFAGGAAFHLGTTLLLHVSFWPVVALYLVLVPWTRLATVARLRFRRAR